MCDIGEAVEEISKLKRTVFLLEARCANGSHHEIRLLVHHDPKIDPLKEAEMSRLTQQIKDEIYIGELPIVSIPLLIVAFPENEYFGPGSHEEAAIIYSHL